MMAHSGFGVGILPAKVFGVVLLIGLIFFVVWALRALDKKQLKKWAIWFLVIGFVGTILCSFCGAKKMMTMDKKMMYEKEMCDDEKDCDKCSFFGFMNDDDDDEEELAE